MMPIISLRRGLRDVSLTCPPGSAGRLEDDDLMPALRRDARGLEATRARADNHDLLSSVGFGDCVRNGGLAAGRGVVDAIGRAALIDAIEAVIGANAGRMSASRFSTIFLTICGSVRWARVMPMRSTLPDADRVPRRGDVLNAGGVEGREIGGGPDLSSEIEMRRARHALDRNDIRQARVGVDMAPDDVEEVDKTAILQAPRDFQAVRLGLIPPASRSSPTETDADDEFVADPPAHGAQDVKGETQPIVERAAIGGGSSVLVSGDQN